MDVLTQTIATVVTIGAFIMAITLIAVGPLIMAGLLWVDYHHRLAVWMLVVQLVIWIVFYVA